MPKERRKRRKRKSEADQLLENVALYPIPQGRNVPARGVTTLVVRETPPSSSSSSSPSLPTTPLSFWALDHGQRPTFVKVRVRGDGRCLLYALMVATRDGDGDHPSEGEANQLRIDMATHLLERWTDEDWAARIPSQWATVDKHQQALTRQAYVERFLRDPLAHLPNTAIIVWQSLVQTRQGAPRVYLIVESVGTGTSVQTMHHEGATHAIVLHLNWTTSVGGHYEPCALSWSPLNDPAFMLPITEHTVQRLDAYAEAVRKAHTADARRARRRIETAPMGPLPQLWLAPAGSAGAG